MRKYLLLLILLSIGIVLVPLGVMVMLFVRPFEKKGTSGSWYTAIWSWPLVYFNLGCTLKIEGRENIEKGKNYVIIANHSAMLDIPMVQLTGLDMRWVSKSSLLFFPMVGIVLLVQNAILLKRGDAKSAKNMMQKGVGFLKKGVSVSIFPEGTRTKDGKIGEFKAGAFLMAKQAGVDVLPMFLYNSTETEGNKGRVKLRVKILPPQQIGEQRLSEFSQNLNEMYRKEFDKE